MRLRTLLLSFGLGLPAIAQVWLPDGTQIRPWQKDATLLRQNNRQLNHGLERIEPTGRRTHLGYPEYLDIQGEMTFWNGCALVQGHRHHPALDRLSRANNYLATEIWVSRDFKTWQPFATFGPDPESLKTTDRPWSYGQAITALHPLDNGTYLASMSNEFAIFHRGPDGRLIWDRNLEPMSSRAVIVRTSKGIVLLAAGSHVIEYRVLSSRDAKLEREGILDPHLEGALPRHARVRPDGNLLIPMQKDLYFSTRFMSGDDFSPSSLAAMNLLNNRARKKCSSDITHETLWLILDPATGRQEVIPPLIGFPTDGESSLYRLQFRDANNLEW